MDGFTTLYTTCAILRRQHHDLFYFKLSFDVMCLNGSVKEPFHGTYCSTGCSWCAVSLDHIIRRAAWPNGFGTKLFYYVAKLLVAFDRALYSMRHYGEAMEESVSV